MITVLRTIGIAVLYLVAAPTYLIVGVLKLMKAAPGARAIHSGVIECPHCHELNDLDVKAQCPRCKRVDYGSRLRCRCGNEAASFECDHCDATIDVF